MRQYRDILTQLLFRAVLALPMVVAGWYLVASIGTGRAAAPVLLVAMGCFIGAGVLLAGPLARLFAEPAGGMYTPSLTPTALRPDYGVAKVLKAQGKNIEAFAEYQKIAGMYPQEVKPYVEMMDIALKDLMDEGMARDVLAKGVAALSEASDQETLRTMFQFGVSEASGIHGRKG